MHLLECLLQLVVESIVEHVLMHKLLTDLNLKRMRLIHLELAYDCNPLIQPHYLVKGFLHLFVDILLPIGLNFSLAIFKLLVDGLAQLVEVSVDLFEHVCLALIELCIEHLRHLLLCLHQLMGINQVVRIHKLHAFGSVRIFCEGDLSPPRHLVPQKRLPLHLPHHGAAPLTTNASRSDRRRPSLLPRRLAATLLLLFFFFLLFIL